MHDKFLRINIPAKYSNGLSKHDVTDTPLYSPKSFGLIREFPIRYEDRITPNDIVLYDFYILSNEADKYFKEVYSRHLNRDNFILEYDTDNIYTNIKGCNNFKDRCVGIFGALITRNEKNARTGYFNDADPDYVYTDDDAWKAFYDTSFWPLDLIQEVE